ncbi:17478_t:CDS:2, partial [Funneliformis caledonium]
QEIPVISQNMTKILEVTDILILEQNKQDLSQSYEGVHQAPSEYSEREKNEQFDIFSESTEFVPMEHNLFLEALADPEEGMSFK